MADDLDGQDSIEIFSGDTRIWGVLSDMFIVKEMTIDTVPDKLMRFTPDGIPETGFDPKDPPRTDGEIDTGVAGARVIPRMTRAALNLEKAYVIQHYLDPSRPQMFGRDTEYGARSGMAGDAGLSPAEMGAVGKFTDIFRVSVAKNDPLPVAPISSGGGSAADEALAEAWETRSSFNDLFGHFPGRKDLLYGRFEIRITAHFYRSDQRSGPIFFSMAEWPRDSDEEGDEVFPRGIDREINVDKLIVESVITDLLVPTPGEPIPEDGGPGPTSVVKVTRMAGQVLTGVLAFNRTYHAWGVLCSLPASANCNIPNLDLQAATIEELPTADDVYEDPPAEGSTPGASGEYHDIGVTIDERIDLFMIPKCPDIEGIGFDTVCSASSLTSYLSCDEMARLDYNDRWITITDRYNSALNEIDHLYCIVKALDFKVEALAGYVETGWDVIVKLIGYLDDTLPKLETVGADDIVSTAALTGMKLDLLLLKFAIPLPDVCKDEPPAVPVPPVAPPPAPPAPPPPPLPPPPPPGP